MLAKQFVATVDEFQKHLKCIDESSRLVAEKVKGLYIDGIIIGTGQADYTRDAQIYQLRINNKVVGLIDIPGIEGDEEKFERIIEKALNKAHLVIYVTSDNKKPEEATLKKIKKYLKNDSEVYCLMNTKFFGVDIFEDYNSFEEKAIDEYRKKAITAKSIEKSLVSIIGENYKKYILSNGLLAFCGYAYDDLLEISTITDSEKKLQYSQQQKYLKEVQGECSRLVNASNIKDLYSVIEEHTSDFDANIIESNKRKILARLDVTIEVLEKYEKEILKLQGKYQFRTDNLKSQMERIYNRFSNEIKNMPSLVTSIVTDKYLERIYSEIEKRKGKIGEDFFQEWENKVKSSMESDVRRECEAYMKKTEKDFKEAMTKAVKNFEYDLKMDFKYSNIGEFELDLGDVIGELEFDLKSVVENIVSKIISFAIIGAQVGGQIGGCIGAAIGFCCAVIKEFISCLQSSEVRINNAKSKVKVIFDSMSSQIEEVLTSNLGIEEKCGFIMNAKRNAINSIIKQELQFKNAVEAIKTLNYKIKAEQKIIGGLGYGKL